MEATSLLALTLALLVNICKAQDLDDDLFGIQIVVLVIVGAVLLVCCIGGCVLVCCTKRKKPHNDPIIPDTSAYTDAMVSNQGGPTFAVTNTVPSREKKDLSPRKGVQNVPADELSNDISTIERKKRKQERTDDSTLTSLEDKASNVSRNAKNAIGMVAVGGNNTRKERGRSFGRLNEEEQERIRNVRKQAEQGGVLPFKPVYVSQEENNSELNSNLTNATGRTQRRNLYSTQYSQPPVADTQDGHEGGERQQRTKEEVKARVVKVAKGAGGGVYNTGASTARLSANIVEGFNLLREKKKMEEEQRLEKLKAEGKLDEHESNMQDNNSTLPKPKPKSQLPPGKAKLQQFMGSNNDDVDF